MNSAIKLVDIGANLTHPSYSNDMETVIERAKRAGIEKLMITGSSAKSTRDAQKLAEKYPGYFYYTSGIHPHDSNTWDANVQKEIIAFAAHPQCVAIGECGLDYNRNFSPPAQQREAFEAQVKIACELKKSLFIHERDAHEDLCTILDRYADRLPPLVIHCFTGSAAQAAAYIERGYNIGLTGYLWKDTSEDGVRHALSSGQIPLDRLLLETDAPFMFCNIKAKKIADEIRQKLSEEAKALNKNCSFKRNEPCSLAVICELIAAYANVDPSELGVKTTENARRIYGLD